MCSGDNPRRLEYMNNIKSVLRSECDNVNVTKCEYSKSGVQSTYPICLSDDNCIHQEIGNIKIDGIIPLICKNSGYRTVMRDDK